MTTSATPPLLSKDPVRPSLCSGFPDFLRSKDPDYLDTITVGPVVDVTFSELVSGPSRSTNTSLRFGTPLAWALPSWSKGLPNVSFRVRSGHLTSLGFRNQTGRKGGVRLRGLDLPFEVNIKFGCRKRRLKVPFHIPIIHFVKVVDVND